MNLSNFVIIFFMLVLSAFFSGTEISFNASNKLRLKKSADDGSKTAKMAYKISGNFTEALSAILIGNNLANIAASTAATLIFTEVFSRAVIDENLKSTLVTVISTAVMTLIILIFGEITPKIIAKQNADFIVKKVAYPIRILWIILWPAVKLVMLLVNLLRRVWGKDNGDDTPTVTEDELVSIIESVEEEGVIDEDKSDLLQSAIEFHDTTVEEIMTPRTNVVSLDIDNDFADILETIENSRYSRIPVYEESVDNIIGVLYLNRFYREAVDHEGAFDIRPLLMKTHFLHKTMKLPTALRIMREKQTHIAVVIDEFGGTMGIVSLEDILEEIVGDIWDESDVITHEIIKISDDTYEVSGDMNVYDFFDEIDFDPFDFDSDYSTVGGWATEMLNAEPHIGDVFAYGRLEITVLEMNEPRVTKLRAKLLPPPDEE